MTVLQIDNGLPYYGISKDFVEQGNKSHQAPW